MMSLHAMKKPSASGKGVEKKKTAVPQEKQAVTSNTDLFFLFMNPLRNPNSIFVYMLLILYALGTYSESHHSLP
jgi:hypothetical protein